MITQPLQSEQRFVALDSWRGLAALMVVFFHFPSSGIITTLAPVRNGFLFVTFFFVLSGFVIASAYGRRLATGFSKMRFMLLRLGRVYPIHAFMLAVFVLYELVLVAVGGHGWRSVSPFTSENTIAGLLNNIFLLQGFYDDLTWNKPSWSIAVEYWTYLVFAIGASAIGWRLRLLPLAILMALPTTVMIIFHIGASEPVALFLRCNFCFAGGMMAYLIWSLLHERKLISLLSYWTATGVEIVGTAILLVSVMTYGGKFSQTIGPVFALVVLIFSLERGALSSLLKTPPMLLLGKLSYSIYMVHYFIQLRLLDGLAFAQTHVELPIHATAEGRNVIVGSTIACDIATCLMALIVVGCAWLTFNLVEEPARQWSRRFVARMFASKVTALQPRNEIA